MDVEEQKKSKGAQQDNTEMLTQEADNLPRAGRQRVEIGVSEPRALEERPPQGCNSDLRVGSA